MSPPAATAQSRDYRVHRPVRRRRWVLAMAVFALAGLLVIVTAPLFRKAVHQLTLPLAYSNIIREQAAAKHLDPALIAAVIYAETKFDSRTSPAGAEGLMQILPQTAEFLARRSGATNFTVSDLATPSVNIAYGSYYLRYLLDRYNGNVMLALAAYNAGWSNVDRWVARAGGPGGFTVGDIPFPETRAYVLRVLQAQQDYRHTYPSQLGYSS